MSTKLKIYLLTLGYIVVGIFGIIALCSFFTSWGLVIRFFAAVIGLKAVMEIIRSISETIDNKLTKIK